MRIRTMHDLSNAARGRRIELIWNWLDGGTDAHVVHSHAAASRPPGAAELPSL
jgi:hypothetical protein